jgi:uncharacterized protein YndB with AHSA1/START domain
MAAASDDLTLRLERVLPAPRAPVFRALGDADAVDPPARVAYTFTWEPPDPDDVETLGDLSLDERGGTTEVVLDQGRFKTGERLALHRDGWTESFDKLERLLAARA